MNWPGMVMAITGMLFGALSGTGLSILLGNGRIAHGLGFVAGGVLLIAGDLCLRGRHRHPESQLAASLFDETGGLISYFPAWLWGAAATGFALLYTFFGVG